MKQIDVELHWILIGNVGVQWKQMVIQVLGNQFVMKMHGVIKWKLSLFIYLVLVLVDDLIVIGDDLYI